MMARLWPLVVAIAVGALASAAQAAPPPGTDRDWPCQQRLVPRLAAGSYWSGAPLAPGSDWHADADVAALVARLVPRRVSTEEGIAAIDQFAKTLSGDRAPRLALVFAGLLDETDRERQGLVARLKEIGHNQSGLADLVARLGDELAAIPSDATGEAAAKRQDLQQRRDFTARNFEEIQRTIRYACEAPVALEARLGAWARALRAAQEEAR